MIEAVKRTLNCKVNASRWISALAASLIIYKKQGGRSVPEHLAAAFQKQLFSAIFLQAAGQ
jgi:hypothetical protein